MGLLTENDKLLLKLLKCLKVICQIVIFELGKDLFFYHHLSQKGTKTVNELCKEVHEKKRNLDNAVSHISRDFSFDSHHPDLDITSCILLVTSVVSEKHNPDIKKLKEWKKIKDILDEIKDKRNKIFHEEIQEKFLKGSKESIIKYLKELSNYIPLLFDSIIESEVEKSGIKEKFKKICSDNATDIEIFWTKPLTEENQQQLSKMKEEDVYGRNIISCRSHLKKFYVDKYRINYFLLKNFTYEGELFITPLLTAEDSPSPLCYKNILQKLHGKKKKSKHIQSVLLVGDSGYGKSSLCKNIVQNWCSSEKKIYNSLDSYDFVIVIDETITSEKSLVSYLKNLFQGALHEICDDDDIKNFLFSLQLLFIVDDYDEKSKNTDILPNLFNLFNDKHFIITIKPSYEKNSIAHLDTCDISFINIHLEGIKTDFKLFNIYPHINKNTSMNEQKFEESFKELPLETLTLLKKVPVIYFLVIYISNHDEKINFRTLTISLLFLLTLKFQRKAILSQEEYSKVEGINHCLEAIFLKIGNQCFDCLSSVTEKLYVDVTKFEGEKKFIHLVLSVIFKISPNLRNTNDSSQFEFLHKSQIEFFAAYYATRCWLSRRDNISYSLTNFEKSNLKNNFSVFFTILEILKDEKKETEICFYLDDLIEIIEKNSAIEFNIFWNILNETSKRPKQKRKMLEFLNKKLKSPWCLNEETIINAMNILCFMHIIPECLEIKIKNLFEISSLKDTLNKLQQNTNNLIQNIKLDLHFDTSIKSEDCESILERFSSCRMTLTKFSGHLEENGCNILNSFSEMECINCRITTLEALKVFNEGLSKNKWKEVWLYFDKPFNKMESITKPECQQKYRKINIVFENEISENFRAVISTLQWLQSKKDEKFITVQLRINKDITEMENKKLKEKMISLKDLIKEKIIIKSNQDLACGDINGLQREFGSNIRVEWKFDSERKF